MPGIGFCEPVDFPDVRVTAQDNLPLTSILPDPDEYDDHALYSWGDTQLEWTDKGTLALVF